MFFFFNDTATTEIYTLSLHDALPILSRLLWTSAVAISRPEPRRRLKLPRNLPGGRQPQPRFRSRDRRSEEHTSELQSRSDLVCRLLLEKKKKIYFYQSMNSYGRQMHH